MSQTITELQTETTKTQLGELDLEQAATEAAGNWAAFHVRLDPRGRGIADGHYLSLFNGVRGGWDVVELDDGRFVVLGWTYSGGMPTQNAFQPFHGGSQDATLTRVDLLPARANRYGTSTPACRGGIELQVNSNPAPGNATFEVLCSDAPPNAAGWLLVGTRAVLPVLVSGAGVWLNTTTLVGFPVTSTRHGGFRTGPVPIPATQPAALKLVVQCVWIAPASCPAGAVLAASSPLELF